MKGTFVTSTDFFGKAYQVDIKDLVWRPTACSITVHEGKILTVKQDGKFYLPGGGIELGETPETAVIRETKEETGIEVTNPRPVDSLQRFFTWHDKINDRYVHNQTLILFYMCDFVGDELSMDGLEAGEREISEMPEWVPLEQLNSIKIGRSYNWVEIVNKKLLKVT